ncbi:ABC transporter substrate-binding protein [Belnapia rosea]|uniref:ABC transporter substrate-binding protein n=1 Tax=Belnapia rosea TaxID=938405 RepID=UPI0008877B10|nr:ABC transporter substrate-binding protein [Belnapia rosea]SDB74235.1 NitT/TauT family transport system substrate-binding protein [Belnapia rosea]
MTIPRRAALLAALAAPLDLRHGAAQELRKVTVAGWSPPISEVTNMLAEPDKGIFRARGIALDYLPGQGSASAIQNMLTGRADIAFTDPASLFLAIDAGERLVAVYNVYPQNVFNLVARAGSGIATPADLRGKRVSVYARGSGTWIHLMLLLHAAGLKDSDVTVEVAGPLNFGPLIQGQVDAAAATDTGLHVARARGLKDFTVIEVRDTINLPADVFVVTERAFRERGALIADFLAAYRDSARWMIDRPDEAARLAVTRAINGRDEAMNREIIDLRNASSISETTRRDGLGHFDLGVMQRGADMMHELGLIRNRIDVSAVIRPELLPR